MAQGNINKAVFRASARSFQYFTSLQRKYGTDAALAAMAYCEAHGRMRVYGREAGGVGPGR